MSFMQAYFSNTRNVGLVMRALAHYATCQSVSRMEREATRQMLRTLNEVAQ